MIANTSRLDNTPLPHKSMVADLHRDVAEYAFVHARGGAQDGAGGDEGVAADGYGGVVLSGRGFGGGVCGGGAHEVAADADFGLDDGAAAEDYVVGAVELGFAGYFVAGVGFDVVAFGLGGGFGGHWGRWVEGFRRAGVVVDGC